MTAETAHPLDRDEALRATLPTPVKEQPDPFLQMSTGKSSAAGMALFTLAAVVILSVVLYGLNAPVEVASAPAPSNSSAQAGPANAGGHAAPAAPTAPQAGNHAKG